MGTNRRATNTLPEPTLASPRHWARTRGVRAAENRTKLDAERPAHEPLTQKPLAPGLPDTSRSPQMLGSAR